MGTSNIYVGPFPICNCYIIYKANKYITTIFLLILSSSRDQGGIETLTVNASLVPQRVLPYIQYHSVLCVFLPVTYSAYHYFFLS